MIIGAAYLAAAVLLLYAIWQFWPPAATQQNPAPACNGCNFLGLKFTLGRDRNILLLVALTGALGAIVHGLRSLSKYVGEQIFFRSWLLMYFFLPVVGAALATVVYFVLRAGLITGGSATADPFGFAAISALVGLFSAQAAEKLKRVFEELFAKPEAGGDSIEGLEPPTITDFNPKTGTAGDEVVITGTNFDPEATTVMFGAVEAPAPTVDVSTIRVAVPAGLSPGPVRITVSTPSGTGTSGSDFVVT
jgi:IPT/TIG domain-containing protein